MKKLILYFVFLIVTSNVTAQEPVFTWGDLTSRTGAFANVQILGASSTGYYVVNKREPDETEQRSILRSAFSPVVTVEYFDNTGLKKSFKDISTGRSDDYVNVVYFNNAVYVIYALFSKESGKNSLLAKRIEPNGTESKGFEIASMPATKMSQRGLYYATSSTDGSRLFVIYQSEYSKDQNEKITAISFNTDFKISWNVEYSFPYAWSKSVDNRPFINNQGTAFILKQISEKGSDDRWSVFSFAGKDWKEFKIELQADTKITSVVQGFSPEGDFAVGGYFKEKGGKVSISIGEKSSGDFIYRVDGPGQQLKAGSVNTFEKRNNIIARGIRFHEQTIILLGERYVVSDRAAARTSAPPSNENMFARDYTYNGMDIFLDGFDVAGKPLYNTVIEKDNSSKNDLGYWVSYFAEMAKGKLQVVYMDNKSRYDGKKISINTPNLIVYTSVDPATGKADKSQPVTKPGPVGDKGGDSYLRPDVFLKIEEGKYIIRAENPQQYRMGSINI